MTAAGASQRAKTAIEKNTESLKQSVGQFPGVVHHEWQSPWLDGAIVVRQLLRVDLEMGTPRCCSIEVERAPNRKMRRFTSKESLITQKRKLGSFETRAILLEIIPGTSKQKGL